MSDKSISHRFGLVPENVLKAPPEFWERELFLDLHGVLLPTWLPKFLKFYNDATGSNVSMACADQYFMQYRFGVGLRPATWDDMFLEFVNLVEGGYGSLEPDPVVLKALHRIVKETGVNIKVCTWTPGHHEISGAHDKAYGTGAAQGTTIELLRKMGAPVDLRDIEFCSTGAKMYKMQQNHVPLIIEDCAHTAVQVASSGLACLLIPHPYNHVTFPGITRLKSTAQLAKTVIEFFSKLEEAGVLAPRLAG